MQTLHWVHTEIHGRMQDKSWFPAAARMNLKARFTAWLWLIRHAAEVQKSFKGIGIRIRTHLDAEGRPLVPLRNVLEGGACSSRRQYFQD